MKCNICKNRGESNNIVLILGTKEWKYESFILLLVCYIDFFLLLN